MKRNNSQNQDNKRSGGFTLAELLIVLAIVAVLVGIAVPVFSNALIKAQTAVCQANRRDLIAGYKVDYILKGGKEDSAATVSATLAELGSSAAPTRMSKTTFAISGLCRQGGVVTAVCGANGSIFLQCDKHPDDSFVDPSGAMLQAGDFNAAIQAWIDENGDIKDKASFYAGYYADNDAVAMTDEYKAALNAEGLNHTLKNNQLYWWSYPVTDGSGKLLYTVTYANTQSDSAKWTNSRRHDMDPGYVVIVNGKTYMRSESGGTVVPGYSNCSYTTEDILEKALIDNKYKLLP